MPEKITAMKAIKLHCKECCGDTNPKDCGATTCALFPFRLGFNEAKEKRTLSEEERQSAKIRLERARIAKAEKAQNNC